MSGVTTLVSCTSGEDPWPGADGDSGANVDGGLPNEADGDVETDAGEAAPPPPYDFAVKCELDPCATRIAARGGSHACVVLKDGTVRCWGSNASGQLGTGGDGSGPIAGFEATPRAVVGVANAIALAAVGQGNSGTTCVISGGGDVGCFGSDAWGQLGRGTEGSKEPNPAPAPVVGLQAKSVALTNTFALAIGTDDRLWSWGTNDVGQLARLTGSVDAGDAGDAGGSASLAARADIVSPAVRSCAGTSKTGFVVAEDGALLSWGGHTKEQLGRPTSLYRDPIPARVGVADVSSVTSGAAHGCAMGRGRVHCWGANADGQLGTGRKADELLPAAVLLPPGVQAVAVAAGGNNTCIIAANGDVYCWGANGSGQLGSAAGAGQATPRRIEGLAEEAVAIGVMDESICALLRGGSVACWGDNLVGQLGRGTRDLEFHSEPTRVLFE